MAIELDIPDIKVLVRTDPNYNVVIHNPRSSVYRSGSYISIADLALTANTASFAVTASYAQTINRQISGSVGITGSLNITDNLTVEGIISAEKLLVSSSVIYESGSTKFGDSAEDTHQFTGSVLVQGPVEATSGFTGSFKGDGSQLTGLVTDLRISGSTGSDILNLLTDDLIFSASKGIEVAVTDNKVTIEVPVGLSASLYGTASVADGIDVIFAGTFETGSDGVIIAAPSGGYTYISTASYALTASYIANNTWDNLLNIPTGLLSSSVQVYPLPVESASYALTASYAMNGGGGASDWNSITGKPAGLVSSSIQATTWTVATSSVATTASFAVTASYVAGAVSTWNDITGKPAGLVSSSTQINTGSFSGSFTGSLSGTATSASFTTTASYAANAELLDGLNSTVFATTASNTFNGNQTITGSLLLSGSLNFNNGTTQTTAFTGIPTGTVSSSAQIVAALPVGTVSSSLQISTGSFTGSFTGSLTGTITSASYAVTASYAQNATATVPAGTVSSSAQVIAALPTNTVSGSAQITNLGFVTSSATASFAITGSNVFNGNQTITGSLLTNADTLIFSGSIYSTGSNIHTGTQVISGSLTVTGSGTLINIGPGVFSGSVNVTQGVTGSLLGTSSWANQSITASIATTASYAAPSGLPSGVVSSSAQIASFGNIRLAVGTNRSNASAFYFNSNTRTASDSSSPAQDTAFLISSTGLSRVTVYLRQDNAGPNNTIVGVAKNANGSAFNTATLLTSSSLALTQDTIQTYTFSGLTLNQFDTIHIYCDPTNTPGSMFAVVVIS